MPIEGVLDLTKQKFTKSNILKAFKKALKLLDCAERGVGIVFCDDRFIKKLNRETFGLSNVTDVIAYPLADKLQPKYLGDIVVCLDEAKRGAKKFSCSFEEELLRYLVHGLLHLLGYRDDTKIRRAKMEKKQEAILKKLTLG